MEIQQVSATNQAAQRVYQSAQSSASSEVERSGETNSSEPRVEEGGTPGSGGADTVEISREARELAERDEAEQRAQAEIGGEPTQSQAGSEGNISATV